MTCFAPFAAMSRFTSVRIVEAVLAWAALNPLWTCTELVRPGKSLVSRSSRKKLMSVKSDSLWNI